MSAAIEGEKISDQSLIHNLDHRGLLSVHLNRPQASNAFDGEMFRALATLLDRSEEDVAVRALRLSAAGKNFCAGVDIKWMAAHGGEHDIADVPSLPDLLARLANLRVPTVAVIQGACVGAGAALASCCDVIVAAEDAFFAVPEVRIGMPPTAVLPYFAAAVGIRHARRYALTGERITAPEAVRIGFADVVAPRDEVTAAADKLIEAILLGGPSASTLTKKITRLLAPITAQADLDRQIAPDMRAHAETGEAGEGRAAFAARRPPRWAK